MLSNKSRAWVPLMAGLMLSLVSFCAAAQTFDYQLAPQKIAPDTWVLQGKMQDFSRKNAGNIVNTGFVVTEQGVVVFDTGPSHRYGKALRAAIAKITDQPIVHVLNSHHHPDHFLGNQAFADSTIWALPGTGQKIAQQGGAFADNMYRLVGDWMRDIDVQLPHKPLEIDSLAWATIGSGFIR
jgi:glyoxylase-like metal-dependent hydrolase (beta-lactamase superfamily II)